MPLRRSRVDALDVVAYTGGIAQPRPPRQLRDVRAGDRRGARRALPHAAPHGDRPVLGRRGRPRADRAGRGGARPAAGERRMKVAHSPDELEQRPARGRDRHLRRRPPRSPAGDRRCARRGPDRTVVTFHPHPRGVVRGNRVELISTLERRLELLAEAGVEETLVVEFTHELSRLEPEEFAERYLQRDRDGGRRRRRGLPLRPRAARRPRPAARARDRRARDRIAAGRLVDGDPRARQGRRGRAQRPRSSGGRRSSTGIVVTGRRARRDARLSDREPAGRARICWCRAYGIYAGSAGAGRAGIGRRLDRRQSALRRLGAADRAVSCSTSRATSTGGGSSSSSGHYLRDEPRSRARRR